MFCNYLYCADCKSKLWFHTNTVNPKIQYFCCSNYAKNYRSTCQSRHYIRADAIEQIVLLELRHIAKYLSEHKEEFANLLAKKTNADTAKEQKHLQGELQKAIARNEKVAVFYEKLYEDNAEGKVTDEWFMQLSHKYEVERFELKEKIKSINEQPGSIAQAEQNKDSFISAVRKFLEMKSLTPALLQEPIERTEVRKIEGVGKNRTQKVTIYYRFVEHIEIPEGSNYKPDTRKGVAVKYLSGGISA